MLAIVFACSLSAAEPTKVVELDFSKAEAGCVPDRAVPGALPAVVPTFSVYGRLRGKSAIAEAGKRYAAPALGRTGELNAIRLGNSGQGLGAIRYRFQTGKPFALELWMYVYDVRKYFSGCVLIVPPGPVHGRGFSLGFQKAKWSRNGWLEWRWGKGVGSEVFWHKGFLPEQWHHVVISHDTTAMALYVDGKLSDHRKRALPFWEDGGELLVSKRVSTPRAPGLDFKLDQLTLYNAALSADEVKAHYEAGVPARTFTAEREAQLPALKLEIPQDTYGYFRTGQEIRILVDEVSEADELRVNGRVYPLPLKEPITRCFATPGFEEIQLALCAQGRVLKRAAYPVAIVPLAMKSAKVGAGELASRQPEVRALGMKLDRVVVHWAELEPKKQEYDWARLDAVMARSRELGAETILCLTGMPNWVKLADGSANVPAEMARYRKIWRLLANRYDEVKHFEVWNARVPHDALKGSREQKHRDYRVLLRTAAEALREEAPDAKILAGRIDVSDGLETAAYLQENASEWYDIFSARKYSVDPAKRYEKSRWSAKVVRATTKPVWNTASGIRQFARATLLPPKPAATRKPMQNTYPIPTVDEWTGAAWQIQDLALQLADGIERVILETGPSEYRPIPNGTTGLPGPKGLALAVFNGLVRRDAKLSRSPDAPAGVFAIRFEDPDAAGGLILFTSGKATVVTVTASAGKVVLLDLFGRAAALESARVSVSAQPIYLLNAETIARKEQVK